MAYNLEEEAGTSANHKFEVWAPHLVYGWYMILCTIDSKNLEHGPGTMDVGFPSSLGFAIWGHSYSNFRLLL